VNFMFVHFRITSRCDTFTRPPVNCNCNKDWQSGKFLFYFKLIRQIRWLLDSRKEWEFISAETCRIKIEINFFWKKISLGVSTSRPIEIENVLSVETSF
jgi:hypothetical protein